MISRWTRLLAGRSPLAFRPRLESTEASAPVQARGVRTLIVVVLKFAIKLNVALVKIPHP